jgi:hypothetical protein
LRAGFSSQPDDEKESLDLRVPTAIGNPAVARVRSGNEAVIVLRS